ncbi:uncharacterized protein LOC134675737 [Cydia fagiglandana]|uniref:uncharacterized protein LOC134675737 n=1 Tax=Cydia fagiglandana TaxID=1458189 RepID=UPI002FEE1EDB
MLDTISSLEKEASFDMLSDLEPQEPNAEDALGESTLLTSQLDSRLDDSVSMLDTISTLEKEASFDMLSDLEPQEPNAEDALESNATSASLAASLLPLHAGLQRTLGRLLGALPALEAARRELRRELPALRDANDALRHAAPRQYIHYLS